MNFNIFINESKQKPVAAFLALLITAIGLVTTFLIITLYITDRSTDRGVPRYQQVYRIESQFNLPNGDIIRSAKIPFPLAEALQNHPDIESVNYAWRLDAQLNHRGSLISPISVFAVTPKFIEQLQPYRQHLPALGPHEIYITADFNRQYLGLNEPVGKIINLGKNGQFVIKAVVEPQANSSINLPAIIAFNPELVETYQDKRFDWYDTHVYTFVRLHSGYSHFNKRLLPNIVTNNAPPLAGVPFTPSSFLTFSARHIVDMHYDHGYADEFVTTRTQSLLYILYISALFVLFSTSINFFSINGLLIAARRPSLHIKRCIGASNRQLLAESCSLLLPQFLITVALAIMAVLALVSLSSNVQDLFDHLSVAQTLLIFCGVALFIGLMMLSSHLLSLMLFIYAKQKPPTRYNNQQTDLINRIMMTIQLIVTGITLYLWTGFLTQNYTMSEIDYGYHKAHRLTFSLDEAFFSSERVQQLNQQLKQIEGISNLSLSSWQPFDMSRQILSVQHAQQSVNDQLTTINTLSADENFIDVWGLNTLAGQQNRLVASSDKRISYAIVTRAFMHAMGQNNFDDVLNTRYTIPFPGQSQEFRVLRIVNDFYLGEHLPSPQPLLIFIKDRLEKFATLSYSHQQYLPTLISLLKRHGPPGLSVQTVEQIHQLHFQSTQQMRDVIMLTTILALIVMVVSTLIISISEVQRLNHVLKIMEAVGGSVTTSIVFFLRQYVVPIICSLVLALVIGSLLLKSSMQQYQSVSGLVYINAFGALLLLGLAVTAIMTMSLVLCNVQRTGRIVKRKAS